MLIFLATLLTSLASIFRSRASFGADVVSAVRDMGSEPIRTAFRSPWQNGVAERWVGSCRRDLLDHVIILNERHLKRLMSAYLHYYHEDRTHLGLCFAKILYVLKIARFPVAADAPSGLSLHPPSAKILSRRNRRAVYLYI